jgi:MGT family glycosyltransferase
MDRLVNRVRRAYGLDTTRGALLAPSPYLTLVPVTEAYEYYRSDLPAQVMYVGPVTTPHRGETHDDFPWDWFDQDDRPTLYVSMGTIVEGDTVFRYVIDLAQHAHWKAVIAIGRNHQPSEYSPHPDNVLIRQFVPQLEILEYVDAVISHGGNNTVTESLMHGLPLVVVPISADQPDSAAHIQASGAGIRLSPWRLTKRKLKMAIDRVLHDPAYRQHAHRIQVSYGRTDGSRTSAKLIKILIETHQPITRPEGMAPTILPEDVNRLYKAYGLDSRQHDQPAS